MLIVFVSPVSEERLGRVQNGGIIVLLPAAFVVPLRVLQLWFGMMLV